MIELKINNKVVKVKEGATILEAAQHAGIYIPTLCTHSHLMPYGGCRLCIVQIEGQEGFPTACTMPAEEGMVVSTETKLIQELRRRILELILSEHPYTCLICDRKETCQDYQEGVRKAGVTTGCQFCPKKGSCQLEEVIDYIGLKEVIFPIDYKAIPKEENDPFFERDYNLCILCGRCVRVCQEVRGAGAIAFTYRGSKVLVGTAFQKSLLESDCQFCGACVDVCPTGALAEKINKWEGPPDHTVESICPYCGVGCAIKLKVKGNRVIGVLPSETGLNCGQLCLRGRFCIKEIIYSPNRLKTPLIRKGESLLEVSWEEALDFIAKNLLRFKGGQFAFIASAQCTNEDSYIFGKFTRLAMNSDNITLNLPDIEIQKIFTGESNLVGATNYGCHPQSDGLNYKGVIDAISRGKIKALYLTDSIESPDLDKLEFLIVQSVFPLKRALRFAHVVLPAASFAEVCGTITNLRGDVQSMNKAIEPLGKSRPDWWIVCQIASRLGVKGFDFSDVEQIRNESIKFAGEEIKRPDLKLSPLDIGVRSGFYNYRGGSLIDEVKGLREIVEYWCSHE
jgi:predicted molibdopterin-dependent oxidoreductase YjgC